LKKYGVSQGEFDVMYKHHQARCAICLTPEVELPTRLYIDHDHVTGVPRGLLCAACNTLLGTAQDSVTLLQRCIDYLSKPYWNDVLAKHDPLLLREALERQHALHQELLEAPRAVLQRALNVSPESVESRESLRQRLMIERAKSLGLIPF
jgi:hypothetical protein